MARKDSGVQPRYEYHVSWQYGMEGERLVKVFARESAARDFARRMKGFRHHTLGAPRWFHIARRPVKA
jgi:hypothetical protein